jgi:hypothetical protein
MLASKLKQTLVRLARKRKGGLLMARKIPGNLDEYTKVAHSNEKWSAVL